MVVLERDRLVRYELVQRGKGRPSYVYRLSDEAENLFPKNYAALANELLGYLAAQDGPLACERIVAVVEKIGQQMAAAARPRRFERQQRWVISQGLHALKRVKAKLPGSHNRPEFQRHRYPGLTLEAFTDADKFGVTFPAEWDAAVKAVFLGAVFLIDFAHFENRGD